MPIRINLLAEAQAAEEARRKDPVKRGITISGLVIVGMLLWGGFEFAMARLEMGRTAKKEQEWKSREASFKELTAQETRRDEIRKKLDSLTTLSTNRFLWGTALDSFQQAVVRDVQFIRLNSTQTYSTKQEVITKKGKKTLGKSAASEALSLVIEAKDYGPSGEQNYNTLKRRIFEANFFKTNLVTADAIKLRTLNTAPLTDANGTFTTFILECQFPPKVREEK